MKDRFVHREGKWTISKFLILSLCWSGNALFVQITHKVDLSSFIFLLLVIYIFSHIYLLTIFSKMHFLHFAVYLILSGIGVCDSSEPIMHSGHPVIIESGIHPCVDSINCAYLAFQGHCRRVTHSFAECKSVDIIAPSSFR